VIEQARHNIRFRRRQFANIVFANVGRGAIFHTMGCRYKWQPASKLLLSSTAIGEEKNLVWQEPGVDLPQQVTSVLRRRITCDEDLFCLSEAEIESGGQSRELFRWSDWRRAANADSVFCALSRHSAR
jgi:hypothetical protein